MTPNELTPEQKALQANGNRPLTQSTLVRHPDTMEMLADVKPWQDAEGNWLPTEFNSKTETWSVKTNAAPAGAESEG